ncbi:MAG: DNA mismatch repair protein MutS, partial [Firmicutes bacterium]|nr:DNA mismatch repair protein MutS [Bacillota bacterium]
MLRQYFDIKKSCPGSILLYRVGDFYETYGEDAEIASRELEIVLTSRDAGKGKKIQMAGVPHHAVDQYIRALISKGFRLAICDQVEDPKLSKGIVKREVVRIITSGTISDPEMLDSARNNYLMSIGSGRNGYGIAVADVSTGEFWATQIEMTGNGNLVDEVSRWQPAEVLLDPYVGEDEGFKKTLERAKASYLPWEEVPDEAESRKILLEHFKSGTLEGFGIGDSNEAVKAAAVLVKYIRETSKVEASSLKKISVYSAP